MTKDTEPPANLDATKRENALIGYQMAISLWTYQGEQRWARFNIMLFANSVIIGVFGLAFTNQPSLTVLPPFLPFVGLCLCAIWFAFGEREATYAEYYIKAARELEEKYLSNSVQTVARGGRLAEGDVVTLEIAGNLCRVSMGRLARRLRAKTVSNFVIGVLALAYIALLLQGLPLRDWVSKILS